MCDTSTIHTHTHSVIMRVRLCIHTRYTHIHDTYTIHTHAHTRYTHIYTHTPKCGKYFSHLPGFLYKRIALPLCTNRTGICHVTRKNVWHTHAVAHTQTHTYCNHTVCNGNENWKKFELEIILIGIAFNFPPRRFSSTSDYVSVYVHCVWCTWVGGCMSA